MSVYDQPFDRIIGDALHILFDKGADIFTFALYYDHEGRAVSICADTEVNSRSAARKMNTFVGQQFYRAIQNGELDEAAKWGTIGERSLALGDFKFQSLGWRSMTAPNNSAPFYRAMISSLLRNSTKISGLSRNPENLVLCCSSKDSEVGFSWVHQEEYGAE